MITDVTRRETVVPFTFSGGFHVPAGNWISIPQRAIMRDEANYPNAAEFDAYRFLKLADDLNNEKSQHVAAKYTDVDVKYPFWGIGRRAWLVVKTSHCSGHRLRCSLASMANDDYGSVQVDSMRLMYSKWYCLSSF